MKKGDFILEDNKIKFIPNSKGKYIIGCDPYKKITKWIKLLMFFGFYSKYKSDSGFIFWNEQGFGILKIKR
jgi:hypothetical protein